MRIPSPSTSDYNTVTNTSQQLTALVAGTTYLFACDIACWIKQGSNPTASAADGSMYVPANFPVYIHYNHGAKLAVLRAGGSDGNCSLTKVANIG